LEKKYTDKATLEHENKIDGVHLVESWIVESRTKDKSSLYGLSLPIGSWAGTFKITNDDIWNEFVKTGAVKGFSIEGMFSHKLVEASKIDELMERDITKLSMEEANIVIKKIKHLIKTDARYKTGKRKDMIDMEGAAPTISTSYAGQGPTKVISPSTIPEKPKLKQKWSEVFASIK
jgi:hypothetical protein